MHVDNDFVSPEINQFGFVMHYIIIYKLQHSFRYTVTAVVIEAIHDMFL